MTIWQFLKTICIPNIKGFNFTWFQSSANTRPLDLMTSSKDMSLDCPKKRGVTSGCLDKESETNQPGEETTIWLIEDQVTWTTVTANVWRILLKPKRSGVGNWKHRANHRALKQYWRTDVLGNNRKSYTATIFGLHSYQIISFQPLKLTSRH